MLSRIFLERYKGIFFALVGTSSSIWLAVTGQLDLYVHPRYVVFSTILSVIGLVFVLGSLSVGKYRHMHDSRQDSGLVRKVLTVIILLATVVIFLVVKPAPLTTSTAIQRGINNGDAGTTVTEETTELFNSNNFTRLSVKDWASLLNQSTDLSLFSGKNVKISGFVLPDENDPLNIFYVSRFVVTCCAIDARPVGVPVWLPNWQRQYQNDEWVTVDGEFGMNTSPTSKNKVILNPGTVQKIDILEDPYDY